MRLLAIDPGSDLSAAVVYDTETRLPVYWEKDDNLEILTLVATSSAELLVIERMASYGMAVGAEVFETCVWSGRFIERWIVSRRGVPGRFERVYRRDVKSHLCGSQRATDTNTRQALIDRYGPGRQKAVGKKASPGPLYGMKADCWQALGVAITAAETNTREQ